MALTRPRPVVAARPGTPSAHRRHKRVTPQQVILLVVRYLILLAGAIICIVPFFWMVSASFQHEGDIFSWPIQWIPRNPTLGNYRSFFGTGGHIGTWLANTTLVAVVTTVAQLFLDSLMAYAFAKRRFPGRKWIFGLFLATLLVPGQMTIIPNYLILKHIPFAGGNDALGQGGHGWLDSYAGLIVPAVVSAFGIFLIRQYMLSIPDELLDAARVEGASEFRIFWSIVMPLCKPVLAASAIFTFGYFWNDFYWPLIVMSSPEHYTLSLGLALFIGAHKTAWTLLMAGSVIATIPVLIVFLIFQRYFVSGIAMTGIK
ncbi:carbohydrate ABC transporter permease [Microlunatus sp. Gsoil 973]|uniref:carbohydrate ABC transporter permease n=1 Tax=Microlunatus sp. Gsoil 973 TaxID=2672569 RepID=UPI0012B499BB|nr:carbohydrate ABC transporter permease [Microlunatus sp. Gsoil 973]QGN34941.1 ABC transporter permease subunit [Microlunatus sp. Gsoil 973]